MSALNNILFIDDEPLMVKDRWEHIPVNNKECMFDLADEISKKLSDVIVINAHFRFIPRDNDFKKYDYMQDCAGIDLLKFLRLLKVNTHCILLSPLSVKQLLQLKPGNLIITSQGVTVFPYYGNFEEIKAENFVDKQASNQLPEVFIRSDLSLPENERHNWANWWGIDRLWNIHRVVEQKKYGLKEPWELDEYPVKLKKKLKKLNNRQALYLYGQDRKRIEHSLNERYYKKKTLSDRLNKFENAKKDIEDVINELQKLKDEKSKISFEEVNDRVEKFAELLKQKIDLENKLFLKRDQLRRITNAIKYLREKLKKADQKIEEEGERYVIEFKKMVHYLENNIRSLKSAISGLDAGALHKKLSKRKPRILYIDDQANDGWAHSFQHIIYGQKTERFKSIQPNKNEEINEEYYEDIILSKITSHKPDVIFLDLRLSGEQGVRVDVEELSGAFVLNCIKNDYPGIPIIATTASNKSWSYEELQRIGVDAYWTKEGIDAAFDEKESVGNYLRILELVELSTSEHFKFVRKFSKKIKEIEKSQDRFWWERMDAPGGYRKIEKKEVVSILYDAMRLVKDYLANVVLKKVDFTNQNQWFYASVIVQHLAKIIELIHDSTKIEGIPDYDRVARSLYRTRHDASHVQPLGDLKGARGLTIEATMEWTNKLMKYLVGDKPKKGLKVLGRFK